MVQLVLSNWLVGGLCMLARLVCVYCRRIVGPDDAVSAASVEEIEIEYSMLRVNRQFRAIRVSWGLQLLHRLSPSGQHQGQTNSPATSNGLWN